MSRVSAQMNPGNINVRLGNLMALDEQAVARGEIATSANVRDLMATYLSVYMTNDQFREYESKPGFVYGDHREEGDVWRDMNAKHRFLLACARPHGVFAKAPELEDGDASILDEEEGLAA